ncbi:hypothetical protein [Mesorhizobium sp. CN2-181]|uniref:hypothetical protein n=1 Tax=Mesorhizobium yinganensis TaxID=3157707 RepID=UPI0032B7FECB
MVSYYPADRLSQEQKAPSASPEFSGDPKAPTQLLTDNDQSLATTAFVQGLVAQLSATITGLLEFKASTAEIEGKAELNGPNFTGVPTAPTASPGTSTTQLATTAFVTLAVTAAVASLLNSAPGALDTLDELAAALGDDANFAANVTNALALLAPKASPTFTGTPLGPTAAPGTNTTQLSTTAFVTAAIAALDLANQLSAKANSASPSLTGTPLTVTPTINVNTTQIANALMVQNIAVLFNPFACHIAAASGVGAPGSASVRIGTTVSASVTYFNIHYTDTLGVDRRAKWLASVKVGSILVLNDAGTLTDWVMGEVTAVTDNTTWMAATVTFLAGSTTAPAGASVLSVMKIG